MGAEDEWAILIDVSTLHPVPKSVRPLENQLPTESRKLWDSVTSRLLKKEYSDATKFKQAIEQKQRDDATERRNKGIECVHSIPFPFPEFAHLIVRSRGRFIPVYFEKDLDGGIPRLTADGSKAVEEELAESSPYPLETAPISPA